MSKQRKKLRETLWRMRNILRALPIRLYLTVTQPQRDRILQKLISGKRVLILGSGPSAEHLPALPRDVLIFACNMSPLFLPLEDDRRCVDLYILNESAYTAYQGRIDPLLNSLSIKVFATRDATFFDHLNVRYEQRIYERLTGSKSNYGFKRLMGHQLPAALAAAAPKGTPSSGMGLLIYALLYGAHEIYVAGIDMNDVSTNANNWHRFVGDVHPHKAIDEAIVRYAASNSKNVFAAIETSPLTTILPYKQLE